MLKRCVGVTNIKDFTSRLYSGLSEWMSLIKCFLNALIFNPIHMTY